ncbi:MAG: thioredoxin family protein [Burkholderiales bacterium]
MDLAREARAAQAAHEPLLVFYTQPDCSYCERARRDYLEPMLADPAQHGRLRVVEVDITSSAPLADFAGHRTTQAAFAASSRIRVVPTIAFLGAGGAALAEPLVGLTLPEFYLTYLERRIDQARALISPPPGRATRATGGG